MRQVDAERAARALRGGAVALVPTETVVGLVAGEGGLHRLSAIKARDPKKPVALLCASKKQAFGLAREVPALAEKLAQRYWPGPLTLVLARVDGGTVGIRVPDHPTVQALLAAYGEPLYATSANPSGRPAPVGLEFVDPSIRNAVDLVVDGKPGTGEASAVVDLSAEEARLLRPTEELNEQKLALLAEQES